MLNFTNYSVIRGSFYKLQREYSKLCKKKFREFKPDLVEKFDNLHENNPILENMNDLNIWAVLRTKQHFSV
jgi:hypothetical protein